MSLQAVFRLALGHARQHSNQAAGSGEAVSTSVGAEWSRFLSPAPGRTRLSRPCTRTASAAARGASSAGARLAAPPPARYVKRQPPLGAGAAILDAAVSDGRSDPIAMRSRGPGRG